MGMLSRIRAIFDPWGARAAWLNERLPGVEFDRPRAKDFTLAARNFAEIGTPLQRDRFGRGIGTVGVGPRTILTANAVTMRREGETLARHNPHARHAVRQIVNSVISNGINIKPATSVKTKKAQLALTTAFTRSFEETNELDNRRRKSFHQLSRHWKELKLVKGGVLIRIHKAFRSDRLTVPIRLQTLTYEYLYRGSSPMVGSGPRDLRKGETFADGIAFNPLGEERAFFLYKSHPDDTPAGGGLDNVVRVEKYDAFGDQQMIHWFEPFMPDDHLGMPRGCIVYNTLARKMDYDFSILDRKRIEAKRTNVWEADHSADPNDLPGRNTAGEWVDDDGVVHTGRPPVPAGMDPIDWFTAQEWANSTGGPAVDNGESVVSPPGYTYKPHEVSNFQDHPAFSAGLLREVAVGFFAPEWLVTGDLRALSFAGGELGLLYWQEDCRSECDDFIVNVFRPIWAAWVAAGERSGMWLAKDITVSARQNRMPKRDLLKDIKTLIAGMNASLISREDAIVELGKDTIEEVNAKILREVAWARKNRIAAEPGLYTSQASGNAGVQATGVAPGAGEDGADDNTNDENLEL